MFFGGRARSAFVADQAGTIPGFDTADTFVYDDIRYQVLDRHVDITLDGVYASIGGAAREVILFNPKIFDKTTRHSSLDDAEYATITSLLGQLDAEVARLEQSFSPEKVLTAICQVGHAVFYQYDIERFNTHWIETGKSVVRPSDTLLPQPSLPVVPLQAFKKHSAVIKIVPLLGIIKIVVLLLP